MKTRIIKETKDLKATSSTLYSYQSITDSFPSDMPKYFRCQLSFNTQSSSLLKDIIICGGIPQKRDLPSIKTPRILPIHVL